MPKPIKSQKEHDRRFSAYKENFRQKYGGMSLEEIAECGKVRGCTAEYRRRIGLRFTMTWLLAEKRALTKQTRTRSATCAVFADEP